MGLLGSLSKCRFHGLKLFNFRLLSCFSGGVLLDGDLNVRDSWLRFGNCSVLLSGSSNIQSIIGLQSDVLLGLLNWVLFIEVDLFWSSLLVELDG